MVQVLQANPKQSVGQRLSQGLGTALSSGHQLMQAHQEKKAKQAQMMRENAAIRDKYDFDLDDIQDPKLRHEIVAKGLQGDIKRNETAEELKRSQQILRKIEKDRNLEEGSLDAFGNDYKAAASYTKPEKEKAPPGGLSGIPPSPEEAKAIKKVVIDNPNASAEQLELAFNDAGIIPGKVKELLESRRRAEEHKNKSEEDKIKELRKETFDIRSTIAEKGMAAEKGIQNKEELLRLIEKGDINDPTYAALASALPLNLGKRLLSNDTVEYKAGLVEEFGDLRNIFQGQTRIKEIELLEEKIADLYLDDDQKKAILNSRLKALKADVIIADAAAEIEDKPYGVLQFQKELDKIAKPKLAALFHSILDEQKAIIQNAENKKKIPLDLKDPDDIKIVDAILLEANNNPKKAQEIARKKGYSW